MSILPTKNLIIAVDSKYGFAKGGKIPWNISEDYNFFQYVTCRQRVNGNNNVVIFGKNTWCALPNTSRSLKNRINIVVSPDMDIGEIVDKNETKTETHLFNNIPSAIEYCKTQKINDIFFCGGKGIYEDALKNHEIDNIYLTQIERDYECDLKLAKELVDNITASCSLQIRKKMRLYDKKQKNNVEVTFSKFTKHPNTIINSEETQYLDMLEMIINTGHRRQTRNAITYSKFGKTLEFDLQNGFPLLTTKKVFFRGIVEELLFFLRGDTNSQHLSEKGIRIWEPNTTREFLDSVGFKHYNIGEMGPMYGFQWRHFNAEYTGTDADYTQKGLDQIKYCMELLKKDPYSRRIIMTTYNPTQANQGVLFPCHGLTILFNVEEGHKLSCMMTQRSADYVCGVPFNIASYALMIHMICEVLNNDPTYTGPKFSPGRLIMNMGDVHVYEDHIMEARRQILREPY